MQSCLAVRTYSLVRHRLLLSPPHCRWVAQDLSLDTDHTQKRHKPNKYWASVANQRAFFDELQKELNLSHWTEWYGVNKAALDKRGGSSLFHYYDSISEALQAAYPEHHWDATQFKPKRITVPSGYWKKTKNLLRVLELAETRLGIKQPEDWYSVSLTDLKEVGFPAGASKSLLAQLLDEKYPGHNWKMNMQLGGRHAQQNRLERAVAALFPNVETKRNVRKEADLVNPDTGDYLELDIYLPSLKLGFEYQDIHHYKSSWYAHDSLQMYQKRDQMKKQLAQDKGISLILVPCWWDGRQDSLVATIKQARSDLLQETKVTANPISEEMEEGFLDLYKPDHVEGVGEPMTATFLVEANMDPSKWWMFEKYDGVRAYWNPQKKLFYSRKGNVLPLPDHIAAEMPSDIFLDGELWFGRDSFKEAAKISQRIDPMLIDWTRFKYMIFDLPTHSGTYQERYNALVKYFSGAPISSKVELAPYVECSGANHLDTYFQDIIDKGGEGVILRDPVSPNQPGRSNGYLKHKKYRDAEARIVKRLGSMQWECELPSGVTFTAMPATSEFVRRYDPQQGDIVSFRHRGFLLGTKKPKLPSLYRVRSDLSWDDIVHNWKEQSPSLSSLPVRRRKGTSRAPKGHWRSAINRRQFLAEIAASMGFDPLDAEKWKEITLAQVGNKARGLLKRYSGSLVGALQDSFPEMKLEGDERRPKNYWRDINNCRAFLDDYAKQRGFDPNNADSWYSILYEPNNELLRLRFVKYHGGIAQTLRKAYPHTQFVLLTDAKAKEPKWGKIANCRSFFDKFASERGFDAAKPDNWYSPTILSEIRRRPGGFTIQELHGGIKKAIQLAYPELDFVKWASAKM